KNHISPRRRGSIKHPCPARFLQAAAIDVEMIPAAATAGDCPEEANMGTLRAAIFLATAALLVGTSPLAEARDFTIVGWGGAAQDTQRKVFFQPFAEQEGVTYQE